MTISYISDMVLQVLRLDLGIQINCEDYATGLTHRLRRLPDANAAGNFIFMQLHTRHDSCKLKTYIHAERNVFALTYLETFRKRF